MIRKILVPLDGTEGAKSALDYALVIANRSGASLTLIRVVNTSLGLDGSLPAGAEPRVAEAEAYLSRITDKLLPTGLDVETCVAYGGRTADRILEAAEARGADLITIATHSRVGHDRWVHGSTSEDIVHESTVPVMLVRARNTTLLAQRFAVPHPVLLVPLDGTPQAESALPFAQDLAETVGAELRLIEVLQCDGPLGLDNDDALSSDFRQEEELESECAVYLEAIGNHVEGEALRVETEVCFGKVALEVSAVSNERAAAGIVMATRGHTGLVRSVLGSVAGSVVRCTNAPVVLIGPKALRPTTRS